ncbi:MAG: hypothetical protein QW228_06835 [Candidatus Aenigmatarchaeota archaeon]
MEILKEVTLSNGQKLTIYRGKGVHLLNAQIRARDPQQILWILLSELIALDDKKVVMEDLLEMDLALVLQIQTAFSEAYGDFLSLPQRQLLVSQGLPDGASQK